MSDLPFANNVQRVSEDLEQEEQRKQHVDLDGAASAVDLTFQAASGLARQVSTSSVPGEVPSAIPDGLSSAVDQVASGAADGADGAVDAAGGILDFLGGIFSA